MFINLLLDPILGEVISYMISHTNLPFKTEQKDQISEERL